jgi:SAM-dependent methyltransferase
MKRVLNVGGGRVRIDPAYDGWDVLLLDIDPRCCPDIIMDARDLGQLEAGQYDAVYCAHNLEHYHEHDIRVVLAGFYRVLFDDGYADIRVPDARAVMEAVVQRDLDLDAVLYQSPVGPIRVCDVLWGYQKEIRESGQDYYAHKFGFSRNLLGRTLKRAGFEYVLIGGSHYELRALAYKVKPETEAV